jgi:mono/diheme cytochrome c family protein
MRNLTLLSTACALALGATLLASGPQSQDMYTGSADYQAFCSSCHGTGAHGDGVVASSLRTKPADLTQLKARNDGVFPAERILKLVTEGHESAGMPAWGEVFAKSQQSEGRDAARLRMEALVQYIETLQPKR